MNNILEIDDKKGRNNGLLCLAYALSRNNQHRENNDLMEFLDTANVNEVRETFPVLLNWCLNTLTSKEDVKVNKNDNDDDDDDDNPVILKTITTTEEVAKKIVKVLEEAIEYEAEDDSGSLNDVEREEVELKNGLVSSLRMKLAGFVHTNHKKMNKIPIVRDLETRIKAKIRSDHSACNTLSMVNLCSPSSLLISQNFDGGEVADEESSWGIPRIHIDLGLGLQQTSPADVCQEFIRDNKPMLHPFTGQQVGHMEVLKVFPSKRKPVWIRYHAIGEQNDDGNDKPLYPDTLAKQGDDLRKDAALASVSKLCESIWAIAPIEWMLDVPPTVCAYDVVVTSPDAGYLEMVPGKTFLELSQKVSSTTDKRASASSLSSNNNNLFNRNLGHTCNNNNTLWEKVDVKKLAPSLVGAYITNFILGVRDRHEDNMMIVGDDGDPKMMQIDFGYILNEYPGGVHFDMPRLTMPVALVDRLNTTNGSDDETTVMEDLQHDMLAAYLVIRRHANQVIPFCSHLLSDSYNPKHVEKVLKGPHVFRLNESESFVIQWFSQKLTTQWAHFHFRREIKQGMVSGYYSFVQQVSSMKNDPKEEEKKTSGNANNFVGKITRFLTVGNRTSRTKSIVSTARNRNFEDYDNDDDDSVYSVPEVITTTNNIDSAAQPVFKKSRSQKSFVFDYIDEQTSKNEGSTDISQLNERVSSAMKLQKKITRLMISQEAKNRTLDLDFDNDGTTSVKSI